MAQDYVNFSAGTVHHKRSSADRVGARQQCWRDWENCCSTAVWLKTTSILQPAPCIINGRELIELARVSSVGDTGRTAAAPRPFSRLRQFQPAPCIINSRALIQLARVSSVGETGRTAAAPQYG